MLYFEIGNVVRLKSGGPMMTIVDKQVNNLVCVWFYDGEQGSHIFPPEALFTEEEAFKLKNS